MPTPSDSEGPFRSARTLHGRALALAVFPELKRRPQRARTRCPSDFRGLTPCPRLLQSSSVSSCPCLASQVPRQSSRPAASGHSFCLKQLYAQALFKMSLAWAGVGQSEANFASCRLSEGPVLWAQDMPCMTVAWLRMALKEATWIRTLRSCFAGLWLCVACARGNSWRSEADATKPCWLTLVWRPPPPQKHTVGNFMGKAMELPESSWLSSPILVPALNTLGFRRRTTSPARGASEAASLAVLDSDWPSQPACRQGLKTRFCALKGRGRDRERERER